MEKVGGFTHRVKSMAMSGLRCGKPWLAVGGPIFSFCTKGLRKDLLAWSDKTVVFDLTAKIDSAMSIHIRN